jgi:hypothetical protein
VPALNARIDGTDRRGARSGMTILHAGGANGNRELDGSIRIERLDPRPSMPHWYGVR